MASPRRLAASMAMERFSLRLDWPVKSAKRVGRRAASNWRSPSSGAGDAIPVSRMLSHQLQRFAEQWLEGGGRLSRFGFAHGGFSGNSLAAQIQQGRQHVLFDGAERRFGLG